MSVSDCDRGSEDLEKVEAHPAGGLGGRGEGNIPDGSSVGKIQARLKIQEGSGMSDGKMGLPHGGSSLNQGPERSLKAIEAAM